MNPTDRLTTPMTRQLAIYDMDRTITRLPTYTPFLWHAMLRLSPWRIVLIPFLLPVFIAYGAKWIDRKRLKEIMQSTVLGAHVSRAKLARITTSFAEKTMARNIHPGAFDAIAEDRAAGRRLVLATASYRLYVEAIAQRLGFDDVIATNSLTGLDDRIMARVDGENCYGPAKLRMIVAWMAANDIDRKQAVIRFYSDHASDEPVLEWSDEPFAVNAHDKLRRLAKVRGWTILDWGF